MRKLLLCAALLCPLAVAAQTTNPFQPAGVINGTAGNVYRLTASGSSTAFQLPTLGAGSGRVQLLVVDEGSNDICVAFGPTQASVATLTVPTLGTGTAGAAGNCHTVKAGNSVVWTVNDAPWVNVQTLSGSSNVSIEAGLGN